MIFFAPGVGGSEAEFVMSSRIIHYLVHVLMLKAQLSPAKLAMVHHFGVWSCLETSDCNTQGSPFSQSTDVGRSEYSALAP